MDVDEIEAAVAEYLNYGIDIDAEDEVTIDDEYELPPLEDWPLEMIVAFCNDNGIPCGWCHTREEYIEAIVHGAKETEETGERIATSAPEEPPRNDNEGEDAPPRNDSAGETARTFSLDQVIENDAEEPENRPEAEG